jgi:hypothetical protein
VKRLVRWFASNPIAANLLMVFVLVAGLVGATTLRQETFPNVAFGFVSVTVAYPGAAPDEIEEAICVRIEEAVDGVKGIHRSFSRATRWRSERIRAVCSRRCAPGSMRSTPCPRTRSPRSSRSSSMITS